MGGGDSRWLPLIGQANKKLKEIHDALVKDIVEGGPVAKVLTIKSVGGILEDDVRTHLRIGKGAEPSQQRVSVVFKELDEGEDGRCFMWRVLID
jgi:hypothetical protein